MTDGFLLNLANTLTGEVELYANLLQCLLWYANTKELADNIRFAGW